MKRILVLILFSSYVTASTQESNELLPLHIIQEKSPSDYALKKIKDIDQKVKKFINSHRSQLEKYAKLNGNSLGFQYDFSHDVSFLKKYVFSENVLIVRQFAALQFGKLLSNGLILGKADSSLKRACTQIIKPDGVMWSLSPESIFYFSIFYTNFAVSDYFEKNSLNYSQLNEQQKKELEAFGIKKSIEFSKDIFENNRDRIVRAYALRNILDALYLNEQYKIANDYYHIMLNDYSDIDEMKDALIRFNPNTALQIGNTVPEFNAQIIKSSETISPEFLKGKNYLIHFWSTTCPPCLAEMAELHQIYERFSGSNFTIVSFSVDDPIVALERFWKSKWPMPWHNVILKNGWKDETAKAFEVISVPKIVFVGTDGKILENQDTLRTTKLADILGKYLNSRD